MGITKTQLAKQFVNNYFRRKIAKIVGNQNTTPSITRCLEGICIDLNAKCLKMCTVTNSGGQTYLFATLDTEGDTTVATIGYCDWKTRQWVSAK